MVAAGLVCPFVPFGERGGVVCVDGDFDLDCADRNGDTVTASTGGVVCSASSSSMPQPVDQLCEFSFNPHH